MASESQNVKDIFLAAVEKASPEERAAYLDQACEGMPDVRRQVEALIAAHEDPDAAMVELTKFLKNSPFDSLRCW